MRGHSRCWRSLDLFPIIGSRIWWWRSIIWGGINPVCCCSSRYYLFLGWHALSRIPIGPTETLDTTKSKKGYKKNNILLTLEIIGNVQSPAKNYPPHDRPDNDHNKLVLIYPA